jgi:hypothetical protein
MISSVILWGIWSEEAGATTGEALGGGGRGGARQNSKRRSSVGEAWDGGCSGTRSGGQRGVGRAAQGRSVGMEEAGHEARRREVERAGGWRGVRRVGRRDAQGRTSGTGSVGRVGGARGGAPGSVGRLDRWVQVIDLWSITWTSQSTKWSSQPNRSCTRRSRTSLRPLSPTCPRFFPSRSAPGASTEPMRHWSSRPSPSPRSSAIFRFCSVILLFRQPFCYKQTKPFYLCEQVIFATFAQSFLWFFYIDSIILWSCQPFCYSGLNHFLVECWDQLFLYNGYFWVIGQSFCYIIATMLNHFCYSAQLFSVATVNSVILSVVISHFRDLVIFSLLQWT